MAINSYETIANSNNKSGALFPENMLAKQLNDSLRQLQADIATHIRVNWVEYNDKVITRVNNKKFRITGEDARDVFAKGNIIKVSGSVTIVKSAVYGGSNTDIEITQPLFKSKLPVYYALQGSTSLNKPHPIAKDDDAIKGYIYAKGDEYKVCIKDIDNLDDKKWADKTNFVSILGLDAAGIRGLGFAQLKVEYTAASKQLKFTETKS